jgi:hypothetical protein
VKPLEKPDERRAVGRGMSRNIGVISDTYNPEFNPFIATCPILCPIFGTLCMFYVSNAVILLKSCPIMAYLK